MGLFDKAKEKVGLGGDDKSEADEIADDWVDEVDSEVSESDGEMEPNIEEEQEPEMREWDSAYKFAEEYLETRGFASMVDFTNKCMAYKINQSPQYRDRIANGVDTMNRVSSMQESLRSVKGDDGGSKNMAEKAEELKAANEVIDQAQKLSGEEDAMVRDMIGLGEDVLQAMTEGQTGGTTGGNVRSSVDSVNEEM